MNIYCIMKKITLRIVTMTEIVIIGIFILVAGVISIEIGIITAIFEILAGIIATLLIHFKVLHFHNVETINVLADIGMVSAMYIAGLDIDIDMLQLHFKKSIIIGLSGFVIPFGVIFFFLHFVLAHFMEISLNQALLLSIIFSATSLSIVSPTLRKKAGGKLGEREKVILSAAMIGELSAIIVWNVFFTKFSIEIVFFIIGLFIFSYIFPFLGNRIFSRFKGNIFEFEFRTILLILLIISVISENIGTESATIAFILGMITSEVVIGHANLEEKLNAIVFGFFGPIFFFRLGMNIDIINMLRTPQNILLIIILASMGLSSTYYGIYLVGRSISPYIATCAAKLFSSNLTLGSIIALFGKTTGILTQELFLIALGVLMIMTITSAILSKK